MYFRTQTPLDQKVEKLVKAVKASASKTRKVQAFGYTLTVSKQRKMPWTR